MKTYTSLLLLIVSLLMGLQSLKAQSCNAHFYVNRYAFVDSVVQFTNSSSPDSNFNVSYRWTIDGVSTGTGKTFNHTFSSIDSFRVCLIRTDSTNNCADTFCRYVVINHQRDCFTRLFSKDTIDSCHVVFIPKYENTRSIDSMILDFGDGDSTTLFTHKRVVHKYNKSDYYLPRITTFAGSGKCKTQNHARIAVSGCQGQSICNNRMTANVIPDSAAIKDTVNYPDARWRQWTMHSYLIQKKGDTLTALDTTYCPSCKGIPLWDICPGSYYVKIALDSLDSFYNNFMPTYAGNVLRWDSVSPNDSGAKNIKFFGIEKHKYTQIQLIKGVNPGGPGFIAGNVTQGANKKEGDPLGGIQIMALNAQKEPLAFTYSRNDGRFVFDNLPLGEIYIYAEIVGVPSLGNWVTLTEDEKEVKDVKVEVTDKYVATSLPQRLQVAINPVTLYPNPAQNTLNISVGTLSGQVSIADLSGRSILEASISENRILNIEALESGSYIVSFVSTSGMAFRSTLIKR